MRRVVALILAVGLFTPDLSLGHETQRPAAEQKIKIAYVQRTNRYELGGLGPHLSARAGHVILVVRIEGISRDEWDKVKGPKAMLEAEGASHEAATQDVSRLTVDKPRPMIIDPFIVLCFVVPASAVKNLRILVGEHSSAPFTAAETVRQVLSDQDVARAAFR